VSGSFVKIEHAAIACRDVRALAQWYCRHLGMSILADDGKQPPAMIVGYGSIQDPSAIEMMPARDAGPDPATQPRFMPGLRHLALTVTDFDAVYRDLKMAGVTFLFEPVAALGGGKVVSFRDPEGNELQIVRRI
jgi:glyoxylase I family protein